MQFPCTDKNEYMTTPLRAERFSIGPLPWPKIQTCALALAIIGFVGSIFFLTIHYIPSAHASGFRSLQRMIFRLKSPFYPSIALFIIATGSFLYLEHQLSTWKLKQMHQLSLAAESLFPKNEKGELIPIQKPDSVLPAFIHRMEEFYKQEPHSRFGHPLYFWPITLRTHLSSCTKDGVHTIQKRLENYYNYISKKPEINLSLHQKIWAPLLSEYGQQLVTAIMKNTAEALAKQIKNDQLFETIDQLLKNQGAYLLFESLENYYNYISKNPEINLSLHQKIWAPLLSEYGQQLVTAIMKNTAEALAKQINNHQLFETIDQLLKNQGAYLLFEKSQLLKNQIVCFLSPRNTNQEQSFCSLSEEQTLSPNLDTSIYDSIASDLSDEQAFLCVQRCMEIHDHVPTIPLEENSYWNTLLTQAKNHKKTERAAALEKCTTMQEVESWYRTWLGPLLDQKNDDTQDLLSHAVNTWISNHKNDSTVLQSLYVQNKANQEIQLYLSEFFHMKEIQPTLQVTYHNAFQLRWKQFAQDGWTLSIPNNISRFNLFIPLQLPEILVNRGIRRGLSSIPFLGYKDWISFLQLATAPSIESTNQATLLQKIAYYHFVYSKQATPDIQNIQNIHTLEQLYEKLNISGDDNNQKRWELLAKDVLTTIANFVLCDCTLTDLDKRSLQQCARALKEHGNRLPKNKIIKKIQNQLTNAILLFSTNLPTITISDTDA